MSILPAALLVVFVALAGLHVYWGLGTPFYDLNRHYYAPLCLAIAAAMAISYGHASQPGQESSG